MLFSSVVLWLGKLSVTGMGCVDPLGAEGDSELCVCHIDLGNSFWSLRLPEDF